MSKNNLSIQPGTPYVRTYRPVKSSNRGTYSSLYTKEPSFSSNGLLRDMVSFYIIQDKFLKIFEYIQPDSPEQMTVYSIQNRLMLIEICTEIESHFKSILKINKYTALDSFDKPTDFMTIDKHYIELLESHRLKDFRIKFLISEDKESAPYEEWTKNNAPTWWSAYNKVKHDKGNNLKEASIENIIDAMAGLIAVIAAQIGTDDPFDRMDDMLSIQSSNESGFERCFAKYHTIKMPEYNDIGYDINVDESLGKMTFRRLYE